MNCFKKSFSIIELFIVIAAIAILFAVTIPRFSFVNQFVLQNEVDKLFTVFSFLQQSAIATNQEQQIIFNLADNSYLHNLKSENKNVCHKLPEVVKFGFLDCVKGPPSSPKNVIQSAVTFKSKKDENYQVTFFTDGKIQPGTVYLIDVDKKNMMSITCPISEVSCIRKYKYDGKRWVCLK